MSVTLQTVRNLPGCLALRFRTRQGYRATPQPTRSTGRDLGTISPVAPEAPRQRKSS